MHTIQTITAVSALTIGMALPIGSMAQTTTTTDHHHSQMEMPQTAASMTEGEVKKIDVDAGKITIKHGPIQHLDMPGMTMVFTAKDKSLLTSLKSGDKVWFTVLNEGGKMIVTAITPVR